MSRTTLSIDDDLLRRIRRKAASEDRTLQDVVNELLRRALVRPRSGVRYELRLEGWDASPQPGVDVTDRDKLFDLMEGR